MADELTERIIRAESDIESLQRQYGVLQQDVSTLRRDMSDLKDEVNSMKVENTQNFSDVKDLLNGVTSKALNSLPPWGAALMMILGSLVGVVAGTAISHFWK